MAETMFDDVMAVRSSWLRGGRREAMWMTAEVGTPWGFVTVYQQAGDDPYVRLDFIWRGKLHMRSIRGRTFTDRGLTRLSRTLARSTAEARR